VIGTGLRRPPCPAQRTNSWQAWSHRRSPSRRGTGWRQTVHVRVIGLSNQGDITLESRTPQTQWPVPPRQAQPQPPHAAELVICD